jgi:hypothetical protein
VTLTRRQIVVGAASGVLGAAGIYELVDRLGEKPRRPAVRAVPREQHLLDGVRIVQDNGVEVLVPPLHHQVVTADLRVEPRRIALRDAQTALEDALRSLERRFETSPSGLGVTIAWGLPYFRHYVPKPADRHLPVDVRASRAKGRRTDALIDAIRFPSDPADAILEDNDVAILLRSDVQRHLTEAAEELLGGELGLFDVTSVRKGFAGGGFDGGRSLPKRMALEAGIPGADLIPDTAELFLGFTSSQRAGLGPPRIANFETLGLVDLGPDGYFDRGTHMHLSHLFEDLEAWYLNFDHDERVSTTFRPRLKTAPGTQTVRQAPKDVSSRDDVDRDFRRFGAIGHSAAIQTSSRLQEAVVGADGTVYPKGTAIPRREDFNTLDNPFFWSARPDVDRYRRDPAAGIHFVVFNPTSDDFHRNRLAMDGVLPDGTKLPLAAGDRAQGINSVLETTHRQNFLVPPRAHRSFPLVELLR